MLRASELRIFNKVIHKESGFIYDISKICDEENITLYTTDEYTKEGIYIDCDTSDIDGIELTEKLISKICFNINKTLGLYRLQCTNDFSISFSLDNDMIYIGDDIEIRISQTPLHRLQNLYFALTGKELEVNF